MKISKVACACLLALTCGTAAADEMAAEKQAIERGRYLVSTSGCNDCHTPGYPESGGILPVNFWLTGAPVGFQGPWGTTYPTNLRLLMQNLSEHEFLVKARQPMRPPMPWFSLRDMNDADLKAIYHFVRSLGPSGKPAPSYARPGQSVSTPFIEFVPKNLPKQAQAPAE
jgi:mono/diheme cytochrome c family protein